MRKNKKIKKLKFLLDIEEFIVFTYEFLAKAKMGPKGKRIGIFGPASNKKECEIIRSIMKMVARKGFTAFSMLGYYRPSDLQHLQSLNFFNKITQFIEGIGILKLSQKPSYVIRRWYLFPTIGSKSIVNLYPPRTQYKEIDGCVDYDIPILGFVIRNKIKGVQNCTFLKKEKNYSICTAHNFLYCKLYSESKKFCPFVSKPISLPEYIREVFINNKKNKLIAVKNKKDLVIPIHNFLLSNS